MNFFRLGRSNSHFLPAIFLLAAIASCLTIDTDNFSDDFDFRKHPVSTIAFSNFIAEDETDSDDGEDFAHAKADGSIITFTGFGLPLFSAIRVFSSTYSVVYPSATQPVYLLCGRLII